MHNSELESPRATKSVVVVQLTNGVYGRKKLAHGCCVHIGAWESRRLWVCAGIFQRQEVLCGTEFLRGIGVYNFVK